MKDETSQRTSRRVGSRGGVYRGSKRGPKKTIKDTARRKVTWARSRGEREENRSSGVAKEGGGGRRAVGKRWCEYVRGTGKPLI